MTFNFSSNSIGHLTSNVEQNANQDYYNSIKLVGRGLQIGFDGTLEDSTITFEPPSTSGVYEIKQDYEYEVDLHFPAVALVTEDINMVIKNGDEEIQIITPTHKDSSTNAKFYELKQLMDYNINTGYRWLFQARCKITNNNVKVLLVYPVVINTHESLTFLSNFDKNKTQVLKNINGNIQWVDE